MGWNIKYYKGRLRSVQGLFSGQISPYSQTQAILHKDLSTGCSTAPVVSSSVYTRECFSCCRKLVCGAEQAASGQV